MSLPNTETSLRASDWITAPLLALTIRVWSKRYGRLINEDEARSILLQVGRLFDVLRRPLPARGRAENRQ